MCYLDRRSPSSRLRSGSRFGVRSGSWRSRSKPGCGDSMGCRTAAWVWKRSKVRVLSKSPRADKHKAQRRAGMTEGIRGRYRRRAEVIRHRTWRKTIKQPTGQRVISSPLPSASPIVPSARPRSPSSPQQTSSDASGVVRRMRVHSPLRSPRACPFGLPALPLTRGEGTAWRATRVQSGVLCNGHARRVWRGRGSMLSVWPLVGMIREKMKIAQRVTANGRNRLL